METGTHLASPGVEERVEIVRKHLEMAIEWKGEHTGLLETRKHYTGYFKGLPGIKEYRIKLLTARTKDEVLSILEDIRLVYKD
jgi:tRNA-dihydrouridine synthase